MSFNKILFLIRDIMCTLRIRKLQRCHDYICRIVRSDRPYASHVESEIKRAAIFGLMTANNKRSLDCSIPEDDKIIRDAIVLTRELMQAIYHYSIPIPPAPKKVSPHWFVKLQTPKNNPCLKKP